MCRLAPLGTNKMPSQPHSPHDCRVVGAAYLKRCSRRHGSRRHGSGRHSSGCDSNITYCRIGYSSHATSRSGGGHPRARALQAPSRSTSKSSRSRRCGCCRCTPAATGRSRGGCAGGRQGCARHCAAAQQWGWRHGRSSSCSSGAGRWGEGGGTLDANEVEACVALAVAVIAQHAHPLVPKLRGKGRLSHLPVKAAPLLRHVHQALAAQSALVVRLGVLLQTRGVHGVTAARD